MPYCPHCGAESEAEAAYCGSCGARLEGEPPPAPPRPPARTGFPWALLGAIVVLLALVVGGVAIYTVLTGNGDGQERRLSSDEDERAGAVASPTLPATPEAVAATPEATASVEPTPVPEESPLSEPTAVPLPSGHATSEEAITAYLQGYGLDYAGDCAYVDLDTDIGSYCSMLWEDRGDQLIYAAGLAFSEPDTWLLLALQGETGGWLVVDAAEFVPGPLDTVPPWP